MNEGTELSITTRALLDAYSRRGGDVEPLLEKYGFEKAEVYDPEAWLPGDPVWGLWAEILRSTEDPHLAMHAAVELPLGAYEIIDGLGVYSPTVGQSLEDLVRFFPLVSRKGLIRINTEEEYVSCRLGSPSDPTAIPRPIAEFTLAALVLRSYPAWPKSCRVLRVQFAGPPGDDPSEVRRLFGCPVDFNAERTQVLFERRVWDMPIDRADPETYSMLVTRGQMLLGQIPRDDWFTDRAREVIGEAFLNGNLDLSKVARRLAVSPRTLQRRLGEAGSSFGMLVADMRRERARRLLRWDLPIAEVAYRLGYSEHSAFTRAFKHWTGSTPANYRQRALGLPR